MAVISCHEEIDDTEAFRIYCHDTALKYIGIYQWYCIPPSMHVILVHGHEIIRHLLLPVGMLSEEAPEANNKNFKRYQDGFSTKFSR